MRRSFRPVVCALEGRLVLSGGGTLSTISQRLLGPARSTESAGIHAAWISTIPVPGDSPLPLGVPLASWLKIHQQFVARAKRHRDDVVFLGDSMTERWTTAGKLVWNSQFAPLRAADFGIHGD